MNPGLVIKLRPTGPWRIGPDSGARNRVDTVYHSDTLFGAVTWAMTRMGSLDEWLNATARSSAPSVSFSSCFPFLDEIGFVIPPRTIWPPTSPGLMSARVRWKSARFVPLGIVQAILGGHRLDPNDWSVDGPSECLLPVGRPGPFRTGVRWSAAVDRLTGAAERHSTACIEFRPGAGLWAIASFADDAARDRWQAPVMAAFRLLADSGFGGERSRGWGRSETPEFVEGVLPDMIVGPAEAPAAAGHSLGAEGEGPAAGGVNPDEPEFEGVPTEAPEVPAVTPDAPDEEVTTLAPELPAVSTPAPEMPPVTPQEGAAVAAAAPAETVSTPAPEATVEVAAIPQLAETVLTPAPEAPVEAATISQPAETVPTSAPEAPVEVAAIPQPAETVPTPAPTPEPEFDAPAPVPSGLHAHWLLSLFTPAADDTIDWQRGDYTLIERGGRVDSPSGSGELKKQLPMVSEGSVLYAATEPRGSATDVAPDGFVHPVLRSGFAVSIPLPEVH